MRQVKSPKKFHEGLMQHRSCHIVRLPFVMVFDIMTG